MHSNAATAKGVFKGYLLSSTGGRHEAIHVRRIHSNGGFGRYRWARRYHPGRHGCASAACAGWLRYKPAGSGRTCRSVKGVGIPQGVGRKIMIVGMILFGGAIFVAVTIYIAQSGRVG
jgi:hypothetical protein